MQPASSLSILRRFGLRIRFKVLSFSWPKKKSAMSTYSHGVGIHQVTGDTFLSESSEDLFAGVQRINGQTVAGKWTRALLSQQERNLFDRIAGLPEVHEFRDIANVDVGIVTGANDFFLVDDATVAEYSLEDYAYPMFGRSGHCPGVVYDEDQHKANAECGYPTNFLWFDEEGKAVPPAKTKEYIAQGETQDLHNRYKCRVT